jgi:hypothetical protein
LHLSRRQTGTDQVQHKNQRNKTAFIRKLKRDVVKEALVICDKVKILIQEYPQHIREKDRQTFYAYHRNMLILDRSIVVFLARERGRKFHHGDDILNNHKKFNKSFYQAEKVITCFISAIRRNEQD